MECDRYWNIPPVNVKLNKNEVHIWCASLDLSNNCLSRLAQTLSNDENIKARRFYFEKDRRDFIIGRGILRSIIGSYLNEKPSKLQFNYGPYGKPYLIKEFDGFDLRFNLAHSRGLAIYAFTRNREIGVDLEYAYLPEDSEKLVAGFFSEEEKAVWFSLPTEQKPEALFVCWTRKEAYIKAVGGWLDKPLNQLAFLSPIGGPDQLKRVSGAQTKIIGWTIETLVPMPGYIATLVLSGREFDPSYYKWTCC